jgi:glycine/D-amino acid oxidase-like deaminating enzyme
LARRSFQLHADLADELDNPWSYQRIETYGGYAEAGVSARGTSEHLWLSSKVTLTGRLGSPQTTAVVEPRAFTTGLMRAAEALGAERRRGTVAGLAQGGVTLDSGEVVEGDAVVIAMGPWSILASLWLKLPAVYGYKGHSLVFETGDGIAPEALFLEYRETSGEILTPELFVRADGTTWVCAISSTGPLPVDPADVAPDLDAHARLEAMVEDISPALAARPIKARQACFRPVTEDGLPLIGAVAGADGVFVATGHSVWGMLNAPATGEAMAELILDGAPHHVDLSPFAPGRLRPLDPARLR